MGKTVNTFDEWKMACESEHMKLKIVEWFLDDNGKERMRVFGLLVDLACFCGSAKELVGWIDGKDGLEKKDLELLNSTYALAPIRKLRRIAEAEGTTPAQDEGAGDKSVFYVKYRIEGRYTAAVHAKNAEEAKSIAREAWESADFGEVCDVDGTIVGVEDENGNDLE